MTSVGDLGMTTCWTEFERQQASLKADTRERDRGSVGATYSLAEVARTERDNRFESRKV